MKIHIHRSHKGTLQHHTNAQHLSPHLICRRTSSTAAPHLPPLTSTLPMNNHLTGSGALDRDEGHAADLCHRSRSGMAASCVSSTHAKTIPTPTPVSTALLPHRPFTAPHQRSMPLPSPHLPPPTSTFYTSLRWSPPPTSTCHLPPPLSAAIIRQRRHLFL